MLADIGVRPAVEAAFLHAREIIGREPIPEAVALLPQIESEESREDLIVATTIFQDDNLRGKIEDFTRARFPSSQMLPGLTSRWIK